MDSRCPGKGRVMGKFKDKRSRKDLLDDMDRLDLEYQTLSKLSTDRYIENQNLRNQIESIKHQYLKQYVEGQDKGIQLAIDIVAKYEHASTGNRKNLLTIILDDLDDLYLKDKK